MRSTRLSLAASVLFLTVNLFVAETASAKQCVFNRGGYVMRVRWYSTVRWLRPLNAPSWMDVNTPVLKDQTITAGFSSCNDTSASLVAVIHVYGCGHVKEPQGGELRSCTKTYLDDFVRKDMRSYYAYVYPGVTDPYCGSPTDAYCWIMAGPAPENKAGNIDLDYPLVVIKPSTTRYLDFWGGTQDVQWGPGGPIPGCGWMNGHDPTLPSDNGRGIVDGNAHASWVAGGASLTTAAGFVGQRSTQLGSCLSRDDFAKLYAALSVTIGAVGRAHAGWVDGVDSRLTSDSGRGISNANAHYQHIAGGGSIPAAADFIRSRMNSLTGIPRDVYAKLYGDTSALLAQCGTNGKCGN